jgi:hypothetical protein
MRPLALLALVALLAACGSAKPAADGAELVPPSTLAFVSLGSDLDGVPRVLDRFPFGPAALQDVRRSLRLRPSMGQKVEVAFFRGGMVELLQPPDEKRFEATLRPAELHARIRGWTVVTDKPALLDLVRRHKERLADLAAYRDATKRLPADAVARAYAAAGATRLVTRGVLGASAPAVVRGARWVSAAVRAHGDELTLELHAKGANGPVGGSTSDLVSQIPADSFLALGFGGGGSPAAVTGGALPRSLRFGGFDLRQIADALDGPAVAYARAGLPFPDVTFASKPRDPQRAVRAVARLVERLGRPKSPPVATTVDGVTLQDVALGAVDIYYGTFDGTLVVSDTTDAVRGLRSHGDKLHVPGLPETTNGFVYVDVEHALPAVKAFAKLANQTVPARLRTYLEPLKTLVVYGTRDGDVQSVVAVVQTR